MQRTDLAIDLVDQFKEALAQAHPMAPQMYEIEARIVHISKDGITCQQ